MAIDWDACVLAPVMAVFGEDAGVLYRPAIGAPLTLTDAVYDANYSATHVGRDGVAIVISGPVLGVREALLTARQGDRLTIVRTGENFAVSEVLSDSHGQALLRLDPADAP